jgi:endonuclease G
MRARVIAVAIASHAVAARADDGPGGAVLGGSAVPAGQWRDCAAALFAPDATTDCTAVLVAPSVALTAGHCNDATLTDVLVGTNNLDRPEDGETIPVARRIEYPSSQETIDITVLELARPSAIPPRAIATGWARFDIADGARVQLVGFGAIDRDANTFVPELQEAETTITDADCTEAIGCNAFAQPAGELGAGGMGTDTCPGDSGGPLYLRAPYGDFLAGITSRSYDDAIFPCEAGGIYARPDKIVDWIEAMVGPVARGPEPSAPPIAATRGGGAMTTIAHGDPRGDEHDYVVVVPPVSGSAAAYRDGVVTYCASDVVGSDAITVEIVDRERPARRLALTIDVTIADGTPPPTCSLDHEVDAGCCSTGSRPTAGHFVLAVAVGAHVARRRRRRRVTSP